MATAKTAPKTPAAKTAKAKKAPARKASAASLRFVLSAKLHTRLSVVLDRIEGAEDAAAHHVEFSETLVETVDEGLDYYFIRTVKQARAGFVVEQTANLGLVGVQRVMAPVIKRILGRMEHEQLLSVAASVRELLK